MRLTLGSKTPGAHDDALWAVVWNQMNGSVLTGSVDETVKCWQQDSADRGVLDHQQTWTGAAAVDVKLCCASACACVRACVLVRTCNPARTGACWTTSRPRQVRS